MTQANMKESLQRQQDEFKAMLNTTRTEDKREVHEML